MKQNKTLKEKYMINGNILETRDGDIVIVANDILTNGVKWINTRRYNDDMEAWDEEVDIVKVYKHEHLTRNLIDDLLDIFKNKTLIWERDKGVRIMSKKLNQIKRVCKRCGTFVTKSDNQHYNYQCEYCDEDLFSIETEVVDISGHKTKKCHEDKE